MSPDEPRVSGQDSGWVEATGKTVAEATSAGAKLVGAESAEDVVVEVLDEPQRGLLGLGGREARVRVRLRADKAQEITKLVEEALGVLGLVGAQVSASLDNDGYLHVGIAGPSLGVLIGRRGETLDALQYLLNLAAARMPGPPQRVVLDVGGYRERRRLTLERLASRVADSVRRSGREMVLEPMTPQERKVIHVFLAGQEGVRSESRGEDPFRRIVVCPSDGESVESGAGAGDNEEEAPAEPGNAEGERPEPGNEEGERPEPGNAEGERPEPGQ